MIVEYDGTEFSGWQTQAEGLRTIQSHLEEKLARIFKTKVHCQASGRTDRGVHAQGQVVHFKIETPIKPALIHTALNAFLDKDITIVDVEEVPLDFNAQKSAKVKTYRYTILNRPSPSALWRNRAYFYPSALNLNLMRKAARHFKGKHDFKSLQSASERSTIKNTVRTIKRLTIIKEDDLIHITITADGFLYRMARNIVSLLIAAGSSKISADAIPALLKTKTRPVDLMSAPSHGLCLMSVQYECR